VSKVVSFFFVVLDEERSLYNKYRYTRWIARSRYGCCWSH